MALKDIVFNPNPQREVEYLGHKIVFRGLTTRDTIEMNLDFKMMSDSVESSDFKSMLANILEILSSTMVSIDGQNPESRQETKEFLLNLPQSDVMELFKLANVFGSDAEKVEIKN